MVEKANKELNANRTKEQVSLNDANNKNIQTGIDIEETTTVRSPVSEAENNTNDDIINLFFDWIRETFFDEMFQGPAKLNEKIEQVEKKSKGVVSDFTKELLENGEDRAITKEYIKERLDAKPDLRETLVKDLRTGEFGDMLEAIELRDKIRAEGKFVGTPVDDRLNGIMNANKKFNTIMENKNSSIDRAAGELRHAATQRDQMVGLLDKFRNATSKDEKKIAAAEIDVIYNDLKKGLRHLPHFTTEGKANAIEKFFEKRQEQYESIKIDSEKTYQGILQELNRRSEKLKASIKVMRPKVQKIEAIQKRREEVKKSREQAGVSKNNKEKQSSLANCSTAKSNSANKNPTSLSSKKNEGKEQEKFVF